MSSPDIDVNCVPYLTCPIASIIDIVMLSSDAAATSLSLLFIL